MEDLSANSTALKDLQRILDAACLLLPRDERQTCRDDVNSVISSIIKTDKKWAEDYSPYQFCAILSLCDSVCCGTPYWPQEVHLSLRKDPTEMVVMWVTLERTEQPQVQYGTSEGALTSTAMAASHTYSKGGWHGWIHSALLTGLTPGAAYYYRVGDPEWEWDHNVYSFRAAPPPAAGTAVHVAFTADIGATDVSDDTVFRLQQDVMDGAVDVLCLAGDISYADGYQPLWDDFMQKVQGVAARVPLMTAPGNHEDFFDFTAYRYRFRMPVEGEDDGGDDDGALDDDLAVSRLNATMYYSFDYGPVHVVAISFEELWGRAPDMEPESGAQYQWLLQDLQRAHGNRENVPWIVVMAHRPLYCTCSSNGDKWCGRQAERYRAMVEELFQQFRVDVYVGGHVHNYERTYPVFNGTLAQSNYSSPTSTTYSVVGAGGTKEGLFNSWQNPAPSWGVPSSRTGTTVGYVIATIDSSSFTWKFYASSNHTVIDSFVITK